MVAKNTNKNGKVVYYVEQREQPLHPSSTSKLMSQVRILFLKDLKFYPI